MLGAQLDQQDLSLSVALAWRPRRALHIKCRSSSQKNQKNNKKRRRGEGYGYEMRRRKSPKKGPITPRDNRMARKKDAGSINLREGRQRKRAASSYYSMEAIYG